MKHLNRRAFNIAALAASPLLGLQALAASWPEGRATSMILPYSPGAGTDVLGRMVTERLAKDTGGAFIMQHKPGATTTVAARQVARSAPEGYTLFLGSAASFCLAPFSYKSLGYDPMDDFEHITLLAESMYVLITSSRWKSLDELLQAAKREPDTLNYASWGIGSTAHLAMLEVMERTGAKLMHVPYNASMPALMDVVGGRIDIMLCTLSTATAQVAGGGVNAVAALSNERLASMPKVPTVAEAGLDGLRAPGWLSLEAPKGTPASILATVSSSVKAALNDSATRDLLDRNGFDKVAFGAQALKDRIRTDLAYFREWMPRAGVTPQ